MNETMLFNTVAIAWLVFAVITFVALFSVTAPYGKFTRRGWGPILNQTVGWVVMESPAVWLMLLFFVLGNRQSNPVALVFLIMWEIHYIQRTYIFPFRMRGNKGKITLVTVLLAIVFNSGNGYLNGYCLFTLSEPYTISWFSDPRFVIGTLVFFFGFGANLHSDAVLRRLRAPGETGYKIPRKGLFRYVSAANYFGEIVEWGGWALATWSPAGLVFFIWTAANLIPRAWSQHKWYKEKFPDYPENRKVLVPFVI